jgi:hypothetical protein
MASDGMHPFAVLVVAAGDKVVLLTRADIGEDEGEKMLRDIAKMLLQTTKSSYLL